MRVTHVASVDPSADITVQSAVCRHTHTHTHSHRDLYDLLPTLNICYCLLATASIIKSDKLAAQTKCNAHWLKWI